MGKEKKRPVTLIVLWRPFLPIVLSVTSQATCGTVQQDLVVGLLCVSGYVSTQITSPERARRASI